MNDTMEKLFGEEIRAKKREIARKALEINISFEIVQKIVDLPLEDLQTIYDEVMAAAK